MMETKHNVPNIELRSEEVQELMGKIPPVILRVGISVILTFVIFIYIASSFIKYPDIISIPIVAKNVNYVTEVKAVKSGLLIELNIEHSHINKGDTLAKILANDENVQDTIFIISPFAGIVYPCAVFQEKDCVEKNDVLCVVADSIQNMITAKTSISADLKEKIMSGIAIESNIDDIMLQGKIVSIADYANPMNGTYAMTMVFENPKGLVNTIVWNSHVNAKIKMAERSVFDKFFKDKVVPTFKQEIL